MITVMSIIGTIVLMAFASLVVVLVHQIIIGIYTKEELVGELTVQDATKQYTRYIHIVLLYLSIKSGSKQRIKWKGCIVKGSVTLVPLCNAIRYARERGAIISDITCARMHGIPYALRFTVSLPKQ